MGVADGEGVLVVVVVGEVVGVAVVVAVGVSVGETVGVTDGVAVSVIVGVVVGHAVGVSDGVIVGVAVRVGVAVAAGMLSPSAVRAPRPAELFARPALINAARARSEVRERVAESYQLPPLNPTPSPLLWGHEMTFASPEASKIPSPWRDPLNDRPEEFARVTARSHNEPERSITP